MASVILRRFVVMSSKPALPCVAHRRWRSSEAEVKDNITKAVKENYLARVDLAVAYRAMEYYKMHEGICNHLTLRAPAMDGNGDVMLLIKHGIHWSQVTANSLVGVDFETGEVIEGEGKVEMSAMNIHRAIHRVKSAEDKSLRCVMHTHQPYTTALACIKNGRFKNIHQNSMRFHNKISYDMGYGGIPDCDESKQIAKSFAGKNICILGNHGVVAVGQRVCDVFDELYYLERAAMTQVLAMSTGKELWEVPDHIAEEVARFDMTEYSENHFESMKALLATKEPDYRS
ncbi:hypothetical protein HOLleu_13490 [Holothuria leucospilota]|uniref:Class II aldolase/adducin N-terminal domain-containing protein n=1 Tax=Holothuria leucospilota TaxID=206669 RepID=A0A9Q1HER5_HOLLE|nr:hypothetical protein HOLleu_13490 [Holothuria leucospilota]